MDKILSPIKARILEYIDYKGIAKGKFFFESGIAAGNFKSAGAKSEIGGDKIVKILSIYMDINPEWLLLGTGQMLRDQQVKNDECRICEEKDKIIASQLITINTLQELLDRYREDTLHRRKTAG